MGVEGIAVCSAWPRERLCAIGCSDFCLCSVGFFPVHLTFIPLVLLPFIMHYLITKWESLLVAAMEPPSFMC